MLRSFSEKNYKIDADLVIIRFINGDLEMHIQYNNTTATN